jgi:HD superfamily phosphohydrolase
VKLIEDKDMWDWRRNVISSELDADKMDYLLRDAYFAGVKYGQYELEQIIESCRIYKAEGGATTLVMSSAGIYALEQLLLARYHMTQQVYQHRVSLISDQMIIRGITLAIKEGNVKMKDLYQYDENDKENFIQRYLNYHDEKLIDILRNGKQKKAREIFNRLYHRELFKMVAELSLKDVKDGVIQLGLLEMADTQKLEWEREIANCLGIDPDFVILYKHQIPSPDYGSRSKILSSESIRVFDDKLGRSRNIWDYATELSFVRSNDTDALSLETVQIYAPLDSEKKERAKLEKAIRRIFKAI